MAYYKEIGQMIELLDQERQLRTELKDSFDPLYFFSASSASLPAGEQSFMRWIETVSIRGDHTSQEAFERAGLRIKEAFRRVVKREGFEV